MSGLLKSAVGVVESVINTVGGAIESLIGGSPTAPPPPPAPAPIAAPPPAPEVAPVPVPPVVTLPPLMPTPIADDKLAQLSARKSIATQIKTRGRASTILTRDGTLGSPPEALGGGGT